ncbi:MAG TPA: ribosomal-processing cysteine protease Prp [Candidatus Eremiobacteraceae bacterium]|nr:ribosomal-processing cysteine protease Prp [Candidatus Eremiobacteraceae bacterium]
MTRSPSRKLYPGGLTVTARRSAGRVVSIGVAGHAGFAPHGRDIVCAAASALVHSAAHGIAAHCGARATVVDEPGGDYRLDVPRGGNARAQAVLESALSGLRAIATSYPRYMRVRVLAGNATAAPKRRRPIRGARK